jgi:ketosteroid isomerase-like protein
MHPNAALIFRFYDAFTARDADAMASCYATDVRFSDPVFPELRGQAAGDLWRMLCESGKDLHLEAAEIEADDAVGRARWVARYTFGATGRPVVNDIRATFRFEQGRIVEHRDAFDFHVWARQALGFPGLAFGWSGWMQRKVQARAARRLHAFRKRRG